MNDRIKTDGGNKETVSGSGSNEYCSDINDEIGQADCTNDSNKDIFDTLVVTDIDGRGMSSSEMTSVALKHLKEGKHFIEMRHGSSPFSDYDDPKLYALLFPTLFPFGLGGPDDTVRQRKILFKSHIQHLFRLRDSRFREHRSFMFVVFNILQRHSINISASLTVKRPYVASIAHDLSCVTGLAFDKIVERLRTGDFLLPSSATDEEMKAVRLMRQVNLVNAKVPGTSGSKLKMRNEIRAMTIALGIPTYYLTINPADTQNPIVKLMFGEEFDLNNMTIGDVPNIWTQTSKVASDPFVPAEFLNMYLCLFFKHVLGYNKKADEQKLGALGVVKVYYGCVEAQGRGSLHCHMLVWVVGGMNPSDLKNIIIDRDNEEFRLHLREYLEDQIETKVVDFPPELESAVSVPSDKCKPSSVRTTLTDDNDEDRRMKDLRNLIRDSQTHKHTSSCFKYSKDECRFGLDPKNTRVMTEYDGITGEISHRVEDGMINPFNRLILECMRCNVDVKFIGSGASAQAILHYVTEFVTKQLLNSFGLYSTIQAAINRLRNGQYPSDNVLSNLKRLIICCANALVSKQELSGQQVASFLMGYEDHYTSHTFRSLYWKMFEHHFEEKCSVGISGETGLKDNIEDPPKHNGKDRADDDDCTSQLDVGNNGDIETADDVMLALDINGKVIGKCNSLTDYIMRPAELSNICLWDFHIGIREMQYYCKEICKKKY